MSKITIPVTYQGGKARIADKIVNIMFAEDGTENFYDLCCGTGAVTIALWNSRFDFPPNVTMLDSSVWGDFWKSVGDGNFIPELFDIYVKNVPEKEMIKSHMEKMAKESPYDGVALGHVYRYLLLQAASFGGKAIWIEGDKWKNTSFRSYWLPTKTSNRRSPVNPMMPMPDTIFERVDTICANLYGEISGLSNNVEDFTSFPEGSIVYIDPPYSETTMYGNSFDIEKWIKLVVSKNKNIRLYVSESFPIDGAGFSVLVSKKRDKGNISGNSNAGVQEWLSFFQI